MKRLAVLTVSLAAVAAAAPGGEVLRVIIGHTTDTSVRLNARVDAAGTAQLDLAHHGEAVAGREFDVRPEDRGYADVEFNGIGTAHGVRGPRLTRPARMVSDHAAPRCRRLRENRLRLLLQHA